MTLAVSAASSTSAMAAASTAKRWRNKRNHDSYETDDDEDRDDVNEDVDDDDDGDGGGGGDENGAETNDRYDGQNNHDRLDDTSNQHIPFWDTYDSVNQLYLEVGESAIRFSLNTLSLNQKIALGWLRANYVNLAYAFVDLHFQAVKLK